MEQYKDVDDFIDKASVEAQPILRALRKIIMDSYDELHALLCAGKEV